MSNKPNKPQDPKAVTQAVPQATTQAQTLTGTGPHAVPAEVQTGRPKYRWRPEYRQGSTASMRLTPAGVSLGLAAKKPGSDTHTRWGAVLALKGVDGRTLAEGGTVKVAQVEALYASKGWGKYQANDLAWEDEHGRLAPVTE